MNLVKLSGDIRRLLFMHACLACTALPLSRAQNAPQPDAATLAKYDKNKNGVLEVDELAAQEADRPRPALVSAADLPAVKPADEIVTLSPFEVVSDNKGYYAANTMSGTRFNSKLEDLAASITVVTKEQMQDFAMLDINDVFLYTASTEGTGTYTDFSVDRNGSVSDNVQLDPARANRVRGIAAANTSLGNVETMGRTPVDPLGIDGIEVSRGPNANVFGLGDPSGTVNMIPSSGNLSRDRSQVQFRADSYDGYRSSLDLNRVLIPGKLAIRGSTAFQHDGFVRKPSGVDTERYNGMIKFQPFRNTTISGSVSYYHQYGNRPNFTPPRDSISYWVQSGRPTWDPVTSQVHLNGVTVGTYTNATGLPDYFNNSFTGSGHNFLFIDQNGVGYWTTPSTFSNTAPLAGATTAGPTSGGQSDRFMAPSSASGVTLGRFANQPLFTTTPTISSKALYDWTDVNLAAVNRAWDRNITANFQLDQIFLRTDRQTVAAQVSAMREDSMRYQRNYIGIANDNGQSGQLMVDVNERLLDSTPNPYFLRTYIGQDQPRTTYQPAKWDTYRAQLAYKLDLTHEQNWLKWLGSHQFSGYDEYKYRINRRYSFREAIIDNHTWIPTGANISRANQGAITGGPGAALSITRSYLRYYVGDNQGANVDYAPGEFQFGNYPFVWGNSATGVFNREPTQLGLAAVTDASGGGSNSKTILKTMGGVVQSHFLGDRFVTNFGLREDQQYQKAGNTPQLLNPDGITFNYDSLNHWAAGDYRFNSGKTKTQQYVVRPFRAATYLNRVEEAGTAGRIVADTLRGLSLTYNRSDSFRPQDPKISLFQNPLPNPSGTTTEKGFGLNMLDGRLVVRFNQSDTRQLNKSGGDAGTIASRVTRLDVSSNAAYLLATQATNWVMAQNPSWTTAQIQTEVARQIGLSTDLQNTLVQEFNAGTLSSTQDVVSKVNELEINFNPTRYWTVAASGTDTRTFNSNVSTDIDQWIAQRLPIWTTITDPRGPDHTLGTADDAPVLWWNTSYGGSQTAAQNYASFIQTPFSVVRAQEGKSSPQIRRYAAKISTNFQLAGLTENRLLKRFNVGGAVRWEDKGAIGYYGVEKLPAVITRLDPNNPIYDKAHYYVDAFVSYRTKLWGDKIGANFQLNVRNIQENGRLQAIGAFPDGTPNAYRIVDPRQFILQATFDL